MGVVPVCLLWDDTLPTFIKRMVVVYTGPTYLVKSGVWNNTFAKVPNFGHYFGEYTRALDLRGSSMRTLSEHQNGTRYSGAFTYPFIGWFACDLADFLRHLMLNVERKVISRIGLGGGRGTEPLASLQTGPQADSSLCRTESLIPARTQPCHFRPCLSRYEHALISPEPGLIPTALVLRLVSPESDAFRASLDHIHKCRFTVVARLYHRLAAPAMLVAPLLSAQQCYVRCKRVDKMTHHHINITHPYTPRLRTPMLTWCATPQQ